MKIQMEEQDGILIVRVLEKRFDARIVPDFRQTIKSRLSNETKKLVLNLEQVEFLDSSGLGAIVSILKSMEQATDMAICNDQGMVSYLFQFTRMNKVFQMLKSEEEALRCLTDQDHAASALS